jgi:hypothetical protein
MTDFTTSFLKRLKGITLSNNERLQLRERIAAYADMHPVVDAPARSLFGGFFGFIESRSFSAYATALIAIIVLGGGVTLAADQSVPGDSLYAIKIDVNEPLMTALTPTATGQAKLAANIATRRIDEAVTLASRGTLTPERQAYLTQEFDTSTKVAAVKADALASTGDSKGSDTVKANFAAGLAGEAQALGAVTTKDSSQSADLLRIVVAASEGISAQDGGDTVLATTSTTDESTTTASTSAAAAMPARRPSLMSAKMMTAATTTATTSATTTVPAARVGKHLRFDISALRQRLASTTLDISALAAPKTDVAIPPSSGSIQTSITGAGQ